MNIIHLDVNEYNALLYFRNTRSECYCVKSSCEYCIKGFPSKKLLTNDYLKSVREFVVSYKKFNCMLEDINIGIFNYNCCLWDECYLKIISFHHSNITYSVFSHSIVSDSTFYLVNFSSCNFMSINFSGTVFEGCTFVDCVFDCVDFHNVKVNKNKFIKCTFIDINNDLALFESVLSSFEGCKGLSLENK
jgi:uncharacterized protein YjbI with pentapeptide repeats